MPVNVYSLLEVQVKQLLAAPVQVVHTVQSRLRLLTITKASGCVPKHPINTSLSLTESYKACQKYEHS